MSYFDGFIFAVPTENKDKFVNHAKMADSLFIEMGALRVVECWGDDIKPGKTNDFRTAVLAEENESIVFSFIEWPDKETRDRVTAKMHADMENGTIDERFDMEKNPMPFDGARLIYGGFAPIVDLSSNGA